MQSLIDTHFAVPYRDCFEEGEFGKRVQFMYGGTLQTVKFRYTSPSIEVVLDRLPSAKISERTENSSIISAEIFNRGIDMWLRFQRGLCAAYLKYRTL